MDVLTGLQIYGIIALSLSITSYIRLYRPAIELLEEIVDKPTIYGSKLGSFLWIVVATIVTPWTLIMLLSNDNTKFIENFAINLSEKVDDNDE